ncbi:hypothetical protein M408DRAFT_10129 [Serendipita vermifera MAFF 305830]|uniref:STE3-domain-containing protein n=1 Tax=Serendipita vermifera MAFF 305830 TaxID=933852 RepID=A0A0C3B1Q8_SERVB|nr:hypothetical protein M408DRAFT_10129 [Serendipita vermifera MAFF 305830]
MQGDLSYMYPVFPIISAFAIVGCIIPIPAHWRAGNIATISLGLWILGCNIIFWVGTVVWHGNIANPYPIWGDIVNVYLAMFPTALASCTLCIQYRLWSIARARNVFITKKDKQRQKYVTWLLCLGLPMLVAVLHYVVQGHRYNIWEDIGPMIYTYNVTLAFPLFFIWDPLICLISAVYGILTIRLFLARRKEFDAVLASGSSNVNKDKYLRLLCLAAVSVVLHLPLSLWVILVNSTAYTVFPWISWEDTHSNYGRIAYFTRFLISQTPDVATQWSVTCWSVVLCGFNYFILFGFGEEAMKHYQGFIGAILKPFGIQYPKRRRRNAIKRTWLDVILGRPGKPTNLSSSAPTSSMPQFTSKATASQPSSGAKTGGNSNHQTRTQTTTANGGNDLHLDLANLDFLDPAEARKQARISAYTRPGQAMRNPVAAKGQSCKADLPEDPTEPGLAILWVLRSGVLLESPPWLIAE